MGVTSTVQPYLPLGSEALNFRSVLYTNFITTTSSCSVNTSSSSSMPVRVRGFTSADAQIKVNSTAWIPIIRLVSGSSLCSVSSSASTKMIRGFTSAASCSVSTTAKSTGLRAASAVASVSVSSTAPQLLRTVTLTPISAIVTSDSSSTANRDTNAVPSSAIVVTGQIAQLIVLRNGAIKTEIVPQDKASGTVLVPVAPQVSNTLVLVPTSKPSGDIVVTRNKYLYDGF